MYAMHLRANDCPLIIVIIISVILCCHVTMSLLPLLCRSVCLGTPAEESGGGKIDLYGDRSEMMTTTTMTMMTVTTTMTTAVELGRGGGLADIMQTSSAVLRRGSSSRQADGFSEGAWLHSGGEVHGPSVL